MVEKLLRSPLVAFALFMVFASMTEYAGWSSMEKLDRPGQQAVILFLMVFPLLVTLLFFLTIWVRPKALLGTAGAAPAPA